MTGPQGERGRLIKLRQEIRADLDAFSGHVEAVRSALGRGALAEDDPMLAVIAVALHHAYGAVESALERIARAFEGKPEPTERWHQELLDQMSLDLPGVRPLVIRPETRRSLALILAFRHFFRHAYAVPLDPVRIAQTGQALLSSAPLVTTDLGVFADRLTEVAEQLS
ncbi:MAG: hypothetical protein RBU30_18800 [Polyangia bacterium]|jgi:hypothetical protein|nr:hypothetical protein [Polyangia bacterium]